MSQEKYLIHALKANVKLEVSYRAGRVVSIKVKSGQFSTKQWLAVGKLIPPRPGDINPRRQHFEGRVTYDKIQKNQQSAYQQFMAEYFDFFNTKMEIIPRINATEGKALKQIISHLTQLEGTEDAALSLWKGILSNWSKLDDFYKDQLDLKQINSNINKILIQLKDGKSTEKGKRAAKTNADDIRESI